MWAQKSVFATAALLMVFCGARTVFAAGREDTDRAVEYLLAYVARSDSIFIRNGQSYDAQQAAAHLRAKYNYFKAQIQTPEDFIRLAGTKSELSGKPYLVQTRGGRVFKSAEWLTQILVDYRAGQQTSEDDPIGHLTR
ncbi:MAG TPA: DUF5329 family protein [Candidatus Binatia bacterium]|jgi:hypothetical protein